MVGKQRKTSDTGHEGFGQPPLEAAAALRIYIQPRYQSGDGPGWVTSEL